MNPFVEYNNSIDFTNSTQKSSISELKNNSFRKDSLLFLNILELIQIIFSNFP